MESGQPRLPLPNHFAGPSETKVFLRNHEPVGGAHHRIKPGLAVFGGRIGDQDACGGGRSAADPAPQLVQLGQSKAVGPKMTIRLALGTSTPTSITVVATSTRSVPSRKAAMVSSRGPVEAAVHHTKGHIRQRSLLETRHQFFQVGIAALARFDAGTTM